MSQASSTFGHYGATDVVPRQWVTAGFSSVVLYAGIIAGAMAIGFGAKPQNLEKPVDVKFVEQVVKEEPPKVEEAKPPPPPPKPEKPKPKKEMEVPKELPKEVPKEAEPAPQQQVAVWIPDEADYASGVMKKGGEKKEVTEELEGVVRAKPSKNNEPPPYPKTARNAGKSDKVTLKIRITTEGTVEDIQLVEGDEPFVTAAIDTVKKWRYSPARYQGKPISVYRVIKIAFQLS